METKDGALSHFCSKWRDASNKDGHLYSIVKKRKFLRDSRPGRPQSPQRQLAEELLLKWKKTRRKKVPQTAKRAILEDIQKKAAVTPKQASTALFNAARKLGVHVSD